MFPSNYLITGSGRGIGRGLGRGLLAQSNRVFFLDSNEQELQNTLSKAPSWVAKSQSGPKTDHTSHPPFSGACVDLRNRDAIKQVIGEVSKFFDGKLHVLVNNAMATPHIWSGGKTMEDEDESIMKEWDEKIAVGLTATFLLSRLCIPLLKAAKDSPSQSPGCIINISSTRATQAEHNHEAYSAVKAGILGLTQSMAVSLGHRYGIRANSIVPGWISVADENLEADRKKVEWDDGTTDLDHQWHPAGRVGKVDDVTKTVGFLAESMFMTGEQIVIDGGVSRKMVYPE